MSLLEDLNNITTREKELSIEKQIKIDKALRSENPSDILKAMEIVKIQSKAEDNSKSTFIDPFSFDEMMGYKNTPNSLSCMALWQMSRAPIILSIIKTRKNQVADFAKPQENRFSTGFVFVPEETYYNNAKVVLGKEQQKEIAELTKFTMQCGWKTDYKRDGFEPFLRKITEDSLVFDQVNFENIRNLRGKFEEFKAVDASTIKIADSWDDTDYGERHKNDILKRKKIAGYFPSAIQVVNGITQAEFYPWELAFGIRNGSSRLNSYGYGRSELEDMISIVTSQLWADQYNMNFFKQGAAPKGILQVKGGTSNPKLEEFKQQWRAMIAGVYNSWRTPIIDAAEMQWIDLQKNSQDMEYQKWQEYLIKLGCALYTIDPSEIGFPMNGSDLKPLFETQNAAKIKYSKDKGLKPLLTFLENLLNLNIYSQMCKYRIKFVGMDAETEEQFRSRLKDEVTNWRTINEVRTEYGDKTIKDGDFILNGIYTSYMQQKEMMEQQNQQQQQPQEEEEENPFEKDLGDQNPLVAEFNEYVDTLWERG